MPRNWKAIAEDSEKLYTEEVCKQAFYQLVTQQCLYARMRNQVTAYRLISRYRKEFEEAADLLGLVLRFNDRLEFCYVVPEVAKHTPLELQETFSLLVLRQLY